MVLGSLDEPGNDIITAARSTTNSPGEPASCIKTRPFWKQMIECPAIPASLPFFSMSPSALPQVPNPCPAWVPTPSNHCHAVAYPDPRNIHVPSLLGRCQPSLRDSPKTETGRVDGFDPRSMKAYGMPTPTSCLLSSSLLYIIVRNSDNAWMVPC
jgi:hypothetical protein